MFGERRADAHNVLEHALANTLRLVFEVILIGELWLSGIERLCSCSVLGKTIANDVVMQVQVHLADFDL